MAGADPGEVKRVNSHPPFSEPPFLHRPQTPQPGFGSITLLQKFTPHFKILDPRLSGVIEKSNLFSPSEYDFRKAHSTQHAILDTVNTIRLTWKSVYFLVVFLLP